LRAGSSVILNGSIAGRIEFPKVGKHSGQEKCMGKFEGKIAFITGGDNGIGFATAKQFVNEGAYVFITGQRDADLAAAIKEIGRNVTGVQGDVSNLRDLDRLFAQIKQEKGKLDIVFASASIAKFAPFGKMALASPVAGICVRINLA
jgi:NAD(P)-dependent dehydrogenase (short-subunit alcohol dehydrogenase family)